MRADEIWSSIGIRIINGHIPEPTTGRQIRGPPGLMNGAGPPEGGPALVYSAASSRAASKIATASDSNRAIASSVAP